MNVASTLLLLSLTVPQSSPPSVDELAQMAETEFQEGIRSREHGGASRAHFRRAAVAFEQLTHHGVRNPLLYRNLGNAWFLAGEQSRAILAYRAGLKLTPRNAGLREGLTLTREAVLYPENGPFIRPHLEDRPAWLTAVAPTTLLGSAVTMYALTWVCFARWLMVRRGRVLLVGMATLAISLGLTSWLIFEQRGNRDIKTAVVIDRDGVFLRKGNGRAFPTRFDTVLPRGAEATLLYTEEGWVQIEMPGAGVGWVPRDAVIVEEAG
jgi:hypothetical protein